MNQSLTQDQKMLLQTHYSERVVLIKKVVEEVNGIVEEYRNTRERTVKGLKDVLAKKSLRHADFANMISDLVEMQSDREEEIRETLREFMKTTEQIALRLEDLLKEPDVKKFKRFINKVRVQQRKRKIEIGKMIEQRFGDTECNLQALLEEFKNERVALNLEWENLREGKERLGPVNLLINKQ